MELLKETLPMVGATIDEDQQTIQILNVVGFAIAMVFNGISPYFAAASLPDITDRWDVRIEPAGYAFAIWGLIYSLLAVFVVYQALPGDMVPDRNDTLIFETIGYQFFINMIINSAWLVIFQTNTLWGLVVALLDIIAMLASNIFMMNSSI